MCTQAECLITGSVDGFLRVFRINPTITSEVDSTETFLSSYVDSDSVTMTKDELIAIIDLTYPLDNASFSSLFLQVYQIIPSLSINTLLTPLFSIRHSQLLRLLFHHLAILLTISLFSLLME